MRTFKCPKCGDVQQALAVEVYHGCPAAQNKTVKYERQEDE